MLKARDILQKWGVLTWRKRSEWNSTFGALMCSFICPMRGHTHTYVRAISCFLFRQLTLCGLMSATVDGNPPHHSYQIIQTFPNVAFTSQWVIVPITLHFLSCEGLSCVVAVRVWCTAAWRTTHYSLMELKVFKWLSLACSDGQVSYKPLSESLITSVLKFTHTLKTSMGLHFVHRLNSWKKWL